jgi:hypothetical protein
MDKSKEQIYDEQISPLMTRIIEICRSHKIPVAACFGINTDEGEDADLVCSTILYDKDWNTPDNIKSAAKAMQQRRSMAIITTLGKDGNVKNITAVVG